MTAVERLMTADEFLVWCLDQEGKWELVDGEPLLMMAGATDRHDRVVVNLIAMLRSRLRGTGCRPTTDDIAARMTSGNIRRPDVTVDCGSGDPRSMTSTTPTVFFEVLSPTTRKLDFHRKPEEYRQVPTLRHFVIVDPEEANVLIWTRDEGGAWRDDQVKGLDAGVRLGGIDLTLPMSEIYEDVPLSA